MPLPRLMVAPNGARLQKSDHPALPITLDEIATCATACHAAGADGLHLHLRTADGQHLLDSGAYREALKELHRALPDLPVQITTEAAGRYGPDVQREVALNSGAAMVSASIREICRDGTHDNTAFYMACSEVNIAIQHILYDRADAELLQRILPEPLLRDPALQLIFVLGRYSADQTSDPAELQPFLDWMTGLSLAPDWALCAFGPTEIACLLHGAAQGGKCRVGFENSIWMANGEIAENNAVKVAELHALLDKGPAG